MSARRAAPEPPGQGLDHGAPENVGEARWRAWGGCWNCRRRAPDGSPRIPCGCRNPSPPFRCELDPYEADYQTYVAYCTRAQR